MTVLSKGGRPRKTGNNGGPVYTTTLKELGLSKRESSEAQLLFLLSKEKPDLWEELLAGKVSRTAAFKTMREQRTKTGDDRGDVIVEFGASELAVHAYRKAADDMQPGLFKGE